jgi:Do/DeqQ family serine protease
LICWFVALVIGVLASGCQDSEPVEPTPLAARQVRVPPVVNPPVELVSSQRAFIEVSSKVTPAVVNVRAERVRRMDRLGPMFEEFFGELFERSPSPQQEQSLGSGFIVSPDGYILTNEHVVSGAEEIKVRLADQRVFAGKVIGTDPKTDVAVIKIEAEGDLPMVVMGDSDALQVGQWALAIGNPFGLDSTLTVGVISATGRANVGIEDYEDFIQTDASINPGNSGGPLLNVYGEVVGINTAIVASGQGIGFAIPINMASMLADQLIASGEVTRGWLGVSIQPLDAELAESFGLDRVTGALINQVLPDGPAEDAGLERGDILLTFNGKAVRGVRELQLLVASTSVGSDVPVEILRDGRQQVINVTIAARSSDAAAAVPVNGESWLGMTLQDADGGVKVLAIDPGSVAAEAGLLQGDLLLAVDRKEVSGLEDFAAVRRQLRPGRNVVLLVRRGETTLYLSLPVPEK